MASRVYDIAFKIAGEMSGNFKKSFATAEKSVKNFSSQINAMNKQAADVSAMIKLKKQIGENARAYAQAKQKVAELGRQISATKNPSKELVAEFNKQKAAMQKARAAIDKQKISLNDLERAAGTAGADLKTLIKREKDLATATDKARKAHEKQQKAIGGIKSGAAGVKENAGYAAASAGAMGAGLVGSVSAAMNFEDNRAELAKFHDDSEKIFADIVGLTRKYGKTAEDMTNMGAAALQAGIAKTHEDVIKIIEAQTQAAVAFGMTGDEVGSAWADIQSKMGLDVGKTKDVFDIINKLGNETSASSADIIEVLQRQGGTLKGLTALTAEQIAGLAGAFRSAAPSAEVAATAMGTFIGRLSNGEAATGGQMWALEKLGFESVTLSKQLTGSSDTAQAAIQGVLGAISKLPKHEQGAVIGQLFGTEAGIKSAVSTLASQSQLLNGNLDAVSNKTNYAGSMFAEYEKRANTTSEKLKIVKNNFQEVAATIGAALLPYIMRAAEAFTNFMPVLMNWISQNKTLIFNLSLVAAGISAAAAVAVPLFVAFKTLAFYGNILKIGLNLLSLAFQKQTYVLIAQKTALVASTIATKAAAAGTKIVTAAQWLWNAALTANPIGIVIVAIAALVAAGIALYKNWDVVSAALKKAWDFIKNDVFFAAINAIKGYLSGLAESAKNIFSSIKGAIVGAMNGAIAAVNGAIGGINKALGGVKVPDWVPGIGGKGIGINIPKIPQLAAGGIATRSTLAEIGEGREPEAVLPLSRLDSMLSGGNGSGNITLNFAPVINLSGSGDAYADIQKGLNAGRSDLLRDLERLLTNNRRLSYA